MDNVGFRFLVLLAVILSSCKGDDYYNLGIFYGKKGDFKTAIEYFDKAIEKNPNDVDALHNRGNSKYWLRDYQGAIEDRRPIRTGRNVRDR